MHRNPVRPKPQLYDVSANFTQDNLLQAILSRRQNLTRDRRLSLSEWVPRLLPEKSVLVQIGANDHSVHYGNDDPGPKCVKLGWNSLLVDPVPQLFAKLHSNYRASQHFSRTRLLNAAVCGSTCSAEAENRTFWSVDVSNATGNWGSNHSDARCAQLAGTAWITEIASLNQWHLLAQSRNIKYTPTKCAKCSKAFNRTVPPDCLKDVVSKNMVSHVVPCTCLAREVREYDFVTLLMIDTEGYGTTPCLSPSIRRNSLLI